MSTQANPNSLPVNTRQTSQPQPTFAQPVSMSPTTTNFNPNNAPITPGLNPGLASALTSLPASTQQAIASGQLSPQGAAEYASIYNDPRGAVAQQHYADVAARTAQVQQMYGNGQNGGIDQSLAKSNPLLYLAQSDSPGGQTYNPEPFISAATRGAGALDAYNNSAAGQRNNALPVSPQMLRQGSAKGGGGLPTQPGSAKGFG